MFRTFFLGLLILPLLIAAAPVTSIWGSAQTDQQRCEAEARYMAKFGVRGHVGPSIGGFEGVGWGAGPAISTCTPGRPMRLTGDAAVRADNGVWFRVRSWR